MRADSVFTVKSFTPTDVTPDPEITTGTPVGVWRMEKSFEGDVVGRAATLFTAAFDQAAGIGTYLALESFEGTVNGRSGTFSFVHSATTTGSDRTAELFTLVPSSGTGELAGITGAGGLVIDHDGTHRMWFDYELPEA